MKTFNQELKEYMVAETIAHREADELVKGTYGENEGGKWKGCAVGCAIQSLNKRLGTDFVTSKHSVLAENGLYPEWLALLQDTLFEGLPLADSLLWPEKFTRSIPIDTDFAQLDRVKWQFCAFILKENISRVLLLDIADDLKKQVVDAIKSVLTVHEIAAITGDWDVSAAENAESAAWSAVSAVSAASAARSAASAASAAWSARSAASAASAAWSARSAAWSARSAAWSAWSAAWSAWSAARSAWSAESAAENAESAASAAYQKYAAELIRLLSDIK